MVANGQFSPIAGHVELPISVAGVTKEVQVAVMPELNADCYLGANFIRIFRAVLDPDDNQLTLKDAQTTIELEVASLLEVRQQMCSSIGLAEVQQEERQRISQLLNTILPPADGPLGCTSWITHTIDVGDATPIKQRYYQVSPKIEAEMHQQVKDMLASGVIEASTSGWSSPVVMVRKPNGSYRFCVDFRKVNAVSKADAYPLPYMDGILRKLQRAKYISTLDLSSAYHQIPLEKNSRPLTAFTVPGMGLFQFTRMPYGLSYAGASFQRLIDMVIGPELEPYAYSYLDDIIIVTEAFEEHIKRLEHVLLRVKEAGLTINAEKSAICREEVKYLGVLVNRDGFRPDPEKIEPIDRYPVPKNRKQLRRFLGMASWYRKFLQDFATKAEPLTRLTSDKVAFEWTDQQKRNSAHM